MANLPIKQWKCGNIKAAIWSNKKKLDKGEVEFKTVSLSRSYKKKDENLWRNESINLRRGDIAKILIVMNEAQKELFLTEKEDEDEED